MPNIYPNSQPQPYYGVNGKLTDDAKALPVPKKGVHPRQECPALLAICSLCF